MIETLPDELVHLIKSAGDSNASIQKLGELAFAVPEFTQLLLRAVTAKGGAHGGRAQMYPARAMVYLGTQTVGNLAICHGVVVAAQRSVLPEPVVTGFFEDALRRAVTIRMLARRRSTVDPYQAFTVGMCMEFGKLLLLHRQPELVEEFEKIQKLCGNERISTEEEVFGATHVQALDEVIERWELDEGLVRPIAMHHRDRRVRMNDALAHMTCLCTAADVVAEVYTATDPEAALAVASKLLHEEQGLSKKETAALIDRVSLEVRSAAEQMGVELPSQPTLAELRMKDQPIDIESMTREELISRIWAVELEKDALRERLDELRARLKSHVLFDPLTGLASRQRFYTSLRIAVVKAKKGFVPLAILRVEVDDFSTLVAKQGLDAANTCLVAVAKVLRDLCRPSDKLARISEHRFSVLLYDCPPSNARVYAERIRAGIEAARIVYRKQRIGITVHVNGIMLDQLAKDPTEADIEQAFYFIARFARGGEPNQCTWATEEDLLVVNAKRG